MSNFTKRPFLINDFESESNKFFNKEKTKMGCLRMMNEENK